MFVFSLRRKFGIIEKNTGAAREPFCGLRKTHPERMVKYMHLTSQRFLTFPNGVHIFPLLGLALFRNPGKFPSNKTEFKGRVTLTGKEKHLS